MQVAIIKDDNEKLVGVVISTSLRHFKSRIESKLGFAIDVPDLVLDVITRHQPLSDYNIRMIAPLFPATTIDYWVNLRDTYNKQCNANLGSKGLSPKYFVAKFVDNTDVMLESASKSILAVQEFVDKNYAEHESDIEIISIEIKQHLSYKGI